MRIWVCKFLGFLAFLTWVLEVILAPVLIVCYLLNNVRNPYISHGTIRLELLPYTLLHLLVHHDSTLLFPRSGLTLTTPYSE